MRTSTQLKALVRNRAKAGRVEAEIILRNFMLERFLERVAVSEYRNAFILKGGMLIAAMVGIDARTTMDLDVTLRGHTLTEARLKEILEAVLSSPVDDNVLFSLQGIEEIREAADYPGYRASVGAVLDRTRQTLHIDITTGDSVIPREIEYRVKLMFENRSINVLAYTIESVLAEKFETIITRSVTNTRMRDFYDVHILTRTQQFDAVTFRAALATTAANRQTAGQVADAASVIEQIATSHVLSLQWRRYQDKYNYAANVTWEMCIGSLRDLAMKATIPNEEDKP